MEYQNHFLREALCAFRYDVAPDQAEPAVEYFHRFYTLLKERGFTAHQQQPFELSFQLENKPSGPEAVKSEVSKGQPSLVLRNESTGYAIIIGVGFLSFNCLKPYPGWSVFLDELVRPFMPLYRELGIRQTLRAVQMAYINEFELESGETAHDYLSHLLPLADLPDAQLAGHSSQSQFILPPNTTVTLQTRVTPGQLGPCSRVLLECNAAATIVESADEWTLAGQAHAAARAAFTSVATPKYKSSIV
ncbi:TIGR04255 family protein [Hymenobacter lutimineralis]|uniref:TIGR04255 family protein n=1 Tax=Hymenobacter lutimineralis TaxID=2606448 RepID=A0A5D6V9R4_9BACT|nr:TIGR04255 family protein [Hymenobacter lutimineralis]TYZ12711.1 TIGR04255 family protein [Hymenobacter lutimineralis]